MVSLGRAAFWWEAARFHSLLTANVVLLARLAPNPRPKRRQQPNHVGGRHHETGETLHQSTRFTLHSTPTHRGRPENRPMQHRPSHHSDGNVIHEPSRAGIFIHI